MKWNFPNCIGALDGKHVRCRAPGSSGSAYYNYKGYFSIVLMALADANYRFLYINVGAKGSASDGGIFNACPLSTAIMNNTVNIPNRRPLPGRTMAIPHCIVADDAFSASESLIKPIPGQNLSRDNRIFNYRLSRARRVIENAFGIASARWRILRNEIEHKPETMKKIVAAICVLHNFCLRHNADGYAPPNLLDRDVHGVTIQGQYHVLDDLNTLQHLPAQRTAAMEQIRNEYKAFFMSPIGELPWQYEN